MCHCCTIPLLHTVAAPVRRPERGCKFSTGTGIWNYQQSRDPRDLRDLAVTNNWRVSLGIPSDPLGFARDLMGIRRDLTRDPPRSIYQQFGGIPRDLARDLPGIWRDPQGFPHRAGDSGI